MVTKSLFDSKLVKMSSKTVHKAHEISNKWLQDMDSLIEENIDSLTCNEIKEMYFSLFGELKKWRSSSSGFTGFSEFLIFRSLYHSINEEFQKEKTGDIGTHPIIFKSTNYEIGQNVKKQINGVNKFPDIYINKNGALKSIIQIKIIMGGGKEQLEREIDTFRIMKKAYVNLKGLHISFLKSNYDDKKDDALKGVGYDTLVLENNKLLIKNVLQKII